jgi:hypothetical protein
MEVAGRTFVKIGFVVTADLGIIWIMKFEAAVRELAEERRNRRGMLLVF